MSILAIDTATQVSSVAVASVDKLAAELTMQAKLTHSETLMPHIKEVLRMANVRKENLEGIAVSIGPGSFTGLRIGLAAAKAMAYALNLPIVGVSTLKALAFHYPVPGIRIVSLLDAQKGNAYRESYEWEHGELRIVNPVEVLPIAEILAESCSATSLRAASAARSTCHRMSRSRRHISSCRGRPVSPCSACRSSLRAMRTMS